MNQTMILFLKILKSDIKNHACKKMGIEYEKIPKNSDGFFKGQLIGKSTIESFDSYRLMNDEERGAVASILESLKRDTKEGTSTSKVLAKQITPLIPSSASEVVEYKDVS